MGLFSAFSSKRSVQASTDLHDLRKDYIDDHPVYFAPEDRRVVRYLDHDLSRDEARVFFDQARRHRSRGAQFEDDHDHQYTLWYLGNRKYKIERR